MTLIYIFIILFWFARISEWFKCIGQKLPCFVCVIVTIWPLHESFHNQQEPQGLGLLSCWWHLSLVIHFCKLTRKLFWQKKTFINLNRKSSEKISKVSLSAMVSDYKVAVLSWSIDANITIRVQKKTMDCPLRFDQSHMKMALADDWDLAKVQRTVQTTGKDREQRYWCTNYWNLWLKILESLLMDVMPNA